MEITKTHHIEHLHIILRLLREFFKIRPKNTILCVDTKRHEKFIKHDTKMQTHTSTEIH